MVPVSECDANFNKNEDDDMDTETGFNEEDNTATGIQLTQKKLIIGIEILGSIYRSNPSKNFTISVESLNDSINQLSTNDSAPAPASLTKNSSKGEEIAALHGKRLLLFLCI